MEAGAETPEGRAFIQVLLCSLGVQAIAVLDEPKLGCATKDRFSGGSGNNFSKIKRNSVRMYGTRDLTIHALFAAKSPLQELCSMLPNARF